MDRDEDMSWQEAASSCAKWGMQLANPNIASVEVKSCASVYRSVCLKTCIGNGLNKFVSTLILRLFLLLLLLLQSRELAGTFTTSYWIGASRDASTEGQWTWMDGSKVAKCHGNAPGPNDVVEQNCIRVVEGVAGLWEAADCSLEMPFMCQKCVI